MTKLKHGHLRTKMRTEN